MVRVVQVHIAPIDGRYDFVVQASLLQLSSDVRPPIE